MASRSRFRELLEVARSWDNFEFKMYRKQQQPSMENKNELSSLFCSLARKNMKTLLHKNINNNTVTVIHYDVKPSLVLNKLKVENKPNTRTEEGIQFLESREGFDILFDHDRGITCFGIETSKLTVGIQKLKEAFISSKLMWTLGDWKFTVDSLPFPLTDADSRQSELLLHNYAQECEHKEFLETHNITVNE